MYDILIIPTSLLKLVGVLPFFTKPLSIQSSAEKAVSVTLFAVALCFFLGVLFSSSFQAVFFLYTLVVSTTDPLTITNPILLAMQFMPFCTLNVRGLLVLFILFLQRNSWEELMKTATAFIQTSFPTFRDRAAVIQKTRRATLLLVVVTFALHLLWEAAEWIVFDETIPNVTMTSNNSVAPLPMPYMLYQYIIVWSFFSTLPFVLSQQVYVCVIVLAITLSEAVNALDSQIHEEIATYEGRFVGEKEVEMTKRKVEMWENCHLRMLLFCGKVNRYFSLILFIIYGMDFLTLLGFTSNLIKNPRTNVDSYLYLTGSTAIFVLYGTVFLMPLVNAYEKSMHLSFSLRNLTVAVKQCLADCDEPSSRVRSNTGLSALKIKHTIKSLEHLEAATQRHVCIFSAVELIHYTRGFVVGTCTLILSFMILAREFFAKEQEAGASPPCFKAERSA